MLFRLLFLFLLFAQPVKAVFTCATHMSNGQQNIYFFNDIHEAYEKAPEQQIAIVNLAKELNAKLFTEEMVDTSTLRNYVHNDRFMAQIELDCMEHLKKEESSRFPLRGLALFARTAGVDARNIDYRQWVDAFRSGRSITGKMAMHMLDSVIADIRSYDDNDLFNEYYRESTDMVTQVFKPLWDYLRAHDEFVADLVRTDEFKEIVAAINADPRKKEFKYSDYWIAFDSRIFDCLLLHTLAQEQDEHVIVCVGAFHANHAMELLAQLGYKKICSLGQIDYNAVAVSVDGFVHKLLMRKLDINIDREERMAIMARAIEDVISKNNLLLKVSSLITALLFILGFLMIILLTMFFIYQIYVLRSKRFSILS